MKLFGIVTFQTGEQIYCVSSTCKKIVICRIIHRMHVDWGV
jgi:hypothetical protein